MDRQGRIWPVIVSRPGSAVIIISSSSSSTIGSIITIILIIIIIITYVRPVHLLRVFLLRVLETNFPGDSLYNYTDMGIPTLRIKSVLESNPLKLKLLVGGQVLRMYEGRTPTRRGSPP